MSITISNLAGTVGGALAGTLAQYYKSGSIVDGLNTYLQGETVKAKAKYRGIFERLKDSKDGSGRGTQIQHATIKQLTEELLFRQNGNYKNGRGDADQTQFRSAGKNYYQDIAALIICDPEKEFFIRDFKEFTEAKETTDKANLYGIVIGTAVSSGITSGVSKLTEGLVQTGNSEYAADIFGSMAVPAFVATGQAWATKRITDAVASKKESTYKERFQATPITTQVQADAHLLQNKTVLQELNKLSAKTDNSIKNKTIEDAVVQILTSENFANYIIQEKQRLYNLNIEPKEVVKDKLKYTKAELQNQLDNIPKTIAKLTAKLNAELKQTDADKTSRGRYSKTSQDLQNEIDTNENLKVTLLANIKQLENDRAALKPQVEQENNLLNQWVKEQLDNEDGFIDKIYTKLNDVLENNPTLKYNSALDKIKKIGTRVKHSNSRLFTSIANKTRKMYNSASSKTRKAYEEFNLRDPLGIIPEERTSGKSSGGSKTRKRRKSTFRKGGAKSTFRKGGAKY